VINGAAIKMVAGSVSETEKASLAK
jgi:hypothetical protein